MTWNPKIICIFRLYVYLSSGPPGRWGPTWSLHNIHTSAALERCVPVIKNTLFSKGSQLMQSEESPPFDGMDYNPKNHTGQSPSPNKSIRVYKRQLKGFSTMCICCSATGYMQASAEVSPECQNNRCRPTLYPAVTDKMRNGAKGGCTCTCTHLQRHFE